MLGNNHNRNSLRQVSRLVKYSFTIPKKRTKPAEWYHRVGAICLVASPIYSID